MSSDIGSPESLGDKWRRISAHIAFSLRTALEAVSHNKLRASLTSLGILFGVASVIAMLAIGKGAEQEILEQMRLLGSNNIIITPLEEQREGKAKDEGIKEPKRYSPGLTFRDAEAIRRVIPNVDATSAEIDLNTLITREGRRRSGKVVGVDTSYFRLTNVQIAEGAWFTAEQVAQGRPVAIIGHGLRTRFFTTEDPIGRPLKVGDTWLTVVGVLADRKVNQATAQRLGIRDANMDVYVPVHTMLLRYRNRASLTQRDIELAARAENNNN
ncbi:MAG: ABC transporter permease, partial [Gemmatimonadaceae bacterium]